MNIISWFLGGTKTKKETRQISAYSYRRGGKTVKVSRHKRSVTVSGKRQAASGKRQAASGKKAKYGTACARSGKASMAKAERYY